MNSILRFDGRGKNGAPRNQRIAKNNAMKTIDFDKAYETLAEFVANKYGNDMLDSNKQSTVLMRSLMNTYDEVFNMIEENPHMWSARVNDYLYALSMEK